MNIKDMKYAFHQDIIIRNMGETVLAYNPENSDMYELNDVAGEILALLKEEKDMEEILRELCTGYNVQEEDILEDVTEIIERMMELGIIKAK
ncbi:MAG: HPr-rel-A system PqqD family peptide chaperone [Lachnospiraceae bacterium]|nr:HPr-rel-A system PqqD family peptide chaperone [Lachnospiraceae bacterium]